jgi:hypothetical protein
MTKEEIPKSYYKKGEKSTVTLKGEKIHYIFRTEFEWLSFVEDRPGLAGVDPTEIEQRANHINELLNRYLDSIEMKPNARDKERKAIGEEITAILEKYSTTQILSASIKDEPPSFSFGGEFWGIGQIYVSLARFLSSEYLQRLGRCSYCKNWFVAPNNHKRKYCPNTDHKQKYEVENYREYKRNWVAKLRNSTS